MQRGDSLSHLLQARGILGERFRSCVDLRLLLGQQDFKRLDIPENDSAFGIGRQQAVGPLKGQQRLLCLFQAGFRFHHLVVEEAGLLRSYFGVQVINELLAPGDNGFEHRL